MASHGGHNNSNTIDADTMMTADVPPDVREPSAFNTFKHVPKSARPPCAAHLAEILRRAARQPELEDNWWVLFNWPTIILQMPKRGGRRRNVTNNIRDRVSLQQYSRLLTVQFRLQTAGAQQSRTLR